MGAIRYTHLRIALAAAVVILTGAVGRGEDPGRGHTQVAGLNATFAERSPSRPRAAGTFPIGWYDTLETPSSLVGMRMLGMNVVLPYTGSGTDIAAYLVGARKSGLKVMVEIDRALLSPPDTGAVREFVATYRTNPALYGWYLADEPTLSTDLGPMTPQTARTMYRTIKLEDPDHPVAIAFGVDEDARGFTQAMDMMLFDDYALGAGKPEFAGLDAWWQRLRDRAAVARSVDGFVPVLQAFGQNEKGKPQYGKRLPTKNEMRYLTYASIQSGATGLLFWARFRSRQDWIDSVLSPLMREVKTFLPALTNGAVPGAVSIGENGVRATTYRDSATQALFLLLVHHGKGTVNARVAIDPVLNVVSAAAGNRGADISGGTLIDVLGPYEAQLYALR